MIFPIKETEAELIGLEQKHPLMIVRLRWLRVLKSNPTINLQDLVNVTNTTEFEMDRWASLYRFGGIDLLLNPLSLMTVHTTQSKTFGDHAKDMLQELFVSHEGQIGRKLWIDFDNCRNNKTSETDCALFGNYKDFDTKFKNWRRTDCQTYIQDVIRYAFEKTGRRDLYNGLLAYYKKNGVTGTIMAQYLVKQGWKAYLFMPDTENPLDNNNEHTKKYRDALKTNKWWDVPLSGMIVNYKPTLGKTNTTPIDSDGTRKLAALAKVKFAACVFTKGIHTGILSEGSILEVHWKSISEQTTVDASYQTFQQQDLYEKTNLLDFGWIEGIFIVPPGSPVIN